MSRAIDADALEKEGWSLHRTVRVDRHTMEYQTKPIAKVPTIELRCEECEAFNKTRLLIPQPERKKGEWILGGYDDMYYVCDQCGYRRSDYYAKPKAKYCENCGAKMEEPEDIPMEYFESGGR